MKPEKAFSSLGKRMRRRFKLAKLSKGIKVFEIVDVKPAETVINDYKKIGSDNYLKVNLNLNRSHSYKVRSLIVKVRFWNSDLKFINQNVTVKMSEKVWIRLLELSEILKMNNYEQGKYVLYWKRNMTCVWLAFITEEQYLKHEEMLAREDWDEIENSEIHWFTRNRKLQYDKFHKFYGGE